MKKTIVHGEAFIHESKIPEGASKVKINGDYKIIAPSETTGNHHVVEITEDVEFYEKDGVLYFRNESPTSVRCVIADRHDAIEIPCGEWEIGIAQEYDPFEARSIRVAD
jgi:hypothetical protein